jgi:hypothetical protein
MAARFIAAARSDDGPAVFYVDNHMCPYTGKKVVRIASSTRFTQGDAATCHGATGGKTFPSHLKVHTTGYPTRREQTPRGQQRSERLQGRRVAAARAESATDGAYFAGATRSKRHWAAGSLGLPARVMYGDCLDSHIYWSQYVLKID